MTKPIDYLDRALTSARREFVTACPFYFLLGKQVLDKPRTPRKTDVFEAVPPADVKEDTTGATKVVDFDRIKHGAPETLMLAVRKVQSAFPSMITVGRTANNDLVISDINISRFHAFFRVHADRVEVADAGSANGTFVGDKQLPPKGAAQILIPGEKVLFAHLEFTFLDAGACWDQLQALHQD